VFWCGPVRRGAAWRGKAVEAGLGEIWRGAISSGKAVLAGSGWVRHGLSRRGLAVKLINKWWAVVTHYTNIRNFLEDSRCLVLIRRPSSVS